MEDHQITELLWQRQEQGLSELRKKYDNALQSFAARLLRSREDGRECINDAYFRIWNAIPPQRPKSLRAFTYQVLRRLCIDHLRKEGMQKRGGRDYALSLEELQACIPGGPSPEEELDATLLKELLEDFLRSLPAEQRQIFLQRYYFAQPLSEIAAQHRCSQGRIKSILHRLRLGLKERLKEELYL